jgi:SAM-dependent methyltransferase
MDREDFRTIDFEAELQKGHTSYDREVGQWWRQQANDGSHQAAYRKVADYCRKLFPDSEPGIVIDYACGPGLLLTRLCRRFPESLVVGIDGSNVQLEDAYERLRRIGKDTLERVSLVESHLPNFSLPSYKADLLVYCFPNLVATTDDQPYYDKHGYKKKRDTVVARRLAKAREPDPEEETVFDEPDEIFDGLMTGKVISRNIRKLLRRGGYCVRVEYANAPRDELTKLVQQRSAFEEGSLKKKVKSSKAKRLFKLVDSTYVRSKVILDVYHQTRDESDLTGGYLINLLKAI